MRTSFSLHSSPRFKRRVPKTDVPSSSSSASSSPPLLPPFSSSVIIGRSSIGSSPPRSPSRRSPPSQPLSRSPCVNRVPGCSTTTSSRVLRSLSVPTNLPDVANNFIKAVEESILEEEEKQATAAAAAAAAAAAKVEERDDDHVLPVLTTPTSNGTDSNINNKKDGFLPLTRTDSQRSDEDFFLPFDDDDDDDVIEEEAVPSITDTTKESSSVNDPPAFPSPPRSVSSPSSIVRKHRHQQWQQKQFGTEAAVSRLEEFFLGQSTSSTCYNKNPNDSFANAAHSPNSTIEIDKALMMEQQLKDPTIVLDSDDCFNNIPESPSHPNFNGNDSLHSVLEEGEDHDLLDEHKEVNLHEASTSKEESKSYRSFTRLNKMNRTTSLPLEFSTSSPSLADISKGIATHDLIPRRSSLKKVSSYSRFSNKQRTNSSNSLKRNVSFGHMQIREYNVALSDHPSCSYGPPIQLSWEYQEKQTIPLDSYEASRIGQRRQGHHLLLSFYERHFLLIKQAGYSKREIKQTMKEVERVKRERMVTDLFLPASPLDETMEHVIDTVKKYFHRPSKQEKNQEQGQQLHHPHSLEANEI